MEIREANAADVADIVNLLKLSLGESLMPKSPQYWQWKHMDNPFGASPVLVALEGKSIVGLRAFMRWTWQNSHKAYRAVRAVDTATHPEFQGKGIFKKLTLSLVDRCKNEGDHFVFNTPNGDSRPGYLKMGWRDAGKLSITVKLKRPISAALTTLGITGANRMSMESGQSLDPVLQRDDLDELIAKNAKRLLHLHTLHSREYIKWRYHDVPVANYFAECVVTAGELTSLIVFRIKGGKAGNELRITDVILRSDADKSAARNRMRELIKSLQVEFVTISADNGWLLSGILRLSSARIGPIVTIRDLADGPIADLQDFRAWRPSLGDLELF